MIDLKVFEKFETENHLLPFSASRLKSYKNNKAKFFLDYVLGYPRVSNSRMERGKAVEFGLDFFYKNPNVQIDECVKIAKNFFKSATSFLDDDEEKQKQYEMIEPMLNQIFDVKEDFWNNLGTGYNDFFTKTQVQIETKISNIPFIGYCDYVFENENVVHVVDLKTKDKFMLTYDDKLQMAIYKKAYQERTNKQLLFSFLLVTGKQPRRKDHKVCEFVPFIPDYDYIGEAETHI